MPEGTQQNTHPDGAVQVLWHDEIWLKSKFLLHGTVFP